MGFPIVSHVQSFSAALQHRHPRGCECSVCQRYVRRCPQRSSIRSSVCSFRPSVHSSVCFIRPVSVHRRVGSSSPGLFICFVHLFVRPGRRMLHRWWLHHLWRTHPGDAAWTYHDAPDVPQRVSTAVLYPECRTNPDTTSPSASKITPPNEAGRSGSPAPRGSAEQVRRLRSQRCCRRRRWAHAQVMPPRPRGDPAALGTHQKTQPDQEGFGNFLHRLRFLTDRD